MDEADLAFDSEQRHLKLALAAQSRSAGSLLRPVGYCHFCGGTDDMELRLFCDSDCASDWEYQDGLRRRLGLPRTSIGPQAASASPLRA